MTENYEWVDDPTVAGVSVCDTDVLNDCLMHLKYENKPNLSPHGCVHSTPTGKLASLSGDTVILSANRHTLSDGRFVEIEETSLVVEPGSVPYLRANSDKGYVCTASANNAQPDGTYLPLNGLPVSVQNPGWGINNTPGFWQLKMPKKILVKKITFVNGYTQSTNGTKNAQFFTDETMSVPLGGAFVGTPNGMNDINVGVNGVYTDTIYLKISSAIGPSQSATIGQIIINEGIGERVVYFDESGAPKVTSGSMYEQPIQPTDAPLGSLWFNTDPTVVDKLKTNPDERNTYVPIVGCKAAVVRSFNGLLGEVQDFSFNVNGYDFNNPSALSAMGMPGYKYSTLTLKASGSTYKAPANGWFQVNKKVTTGGQYFQMYLENKYGVSQHSYCPISYGNCNFMLPVMKNDTLRVLYNAAGSTEGFGFVYAEGERND